MNENVLETPGNSHRKQESIKIREMDNCDN